MGRLRDQPWLNSSSDATNILLSDEAGCKDLHEGFPVHPLYPGCSGHGMRA